MADIPTPKQLLRDYQTMEHRMETAIRGHFGLPAEMSPEVSAPTISRWQSKSRS